MNEDQSKIENGMEEADQGLEQMFEEAFAVRNVREETAWNRFQSSLPERQGWLSFHIAMEETQRHVQQAMQWVHYSARPVRAGLCLASLL